MFYFLGSWICEICVAERNGKRKRPSSSVPVALLEGDDYITYKPPPPSKKGAQKRKGPANEEVQEELDIV